MKFHVIETFVHRFTFNNKIGSIVIFIIITAKKFNINPDNIATPIAASLGDAVTLIILSLVGSFFYIFSKRKKLFSSIVTHYCCIKLVNSQRKKSSHTRLFYGVIHFNGTISSDLL